MRALSVLCAAALVVSLVGCQVISVRQGALDVTDAGVYYLPRGRVLVTVKQRGAVLFLEIGDVELVPDAAVGPLTLDYKRNILSHDKISIGLTDDGLLDEVTIDTDEKTDEFIIRLAELARLAAGIPGGIIEAAREERVVREVRLDPTDKTEVKALRRQLSELARSVAAEADRELSRLAIRRQELRATVLIVPALAGELETTRRRIRDLERQCGITVAGMPCQITPPTLVVNRMPDRPRRQPRLTPKLEAGLCFPSRMAVHLIHRNSLNQPYGEQRLLLPDATRITCLDVSRAAMVQKVSTIDFERGMLTGFTIDKPSEMLAGVEIPIEIAKTIVAIPTELVQLRIDQTSKATELVDAQRKQVEAEGKLLDAIKAAAGQGDPPL